MSSERPGVTPGRIVVLTAPSGGGKTTIARRVMEAVPGLRFSVSATTRPPRRHEKDGRHYHFLSEEDFRARIEEGALVEYEEVYPGRFYGTLRSAVEVASPEEPVLLDIDVQGARSVKRLFGSEALTVFLRPPSIEVLGERLRNRQTDPETDVAVRLDKAEQEIAAASDFDLVVVNDDLETASDETIRAVRTFLGRGDSSTEAAGGG